MRNLYRILVAVFVVIAATACSQFEEQDALPSGDENLVAMTISVGGEPTRTFISEDGKSLNWCENDKIAIFDGVGKREFTIVEGSIEGGYAEFEGKVDAAATSFFAVYPYEAAGEYDAQAGTVSATAATAQQLEGENVSDGAVLSVAQFAKGVESFDFKTAVGYFRVDITFEDITSIIVRGANVAGTATFNAAGEVQSVSEGADQVTLTPAGDVFAAGSYYVALLPGTSPAGDFSVMLTRAEGEALEMTSTKDIEIPRNGGFFLSDYKLVKKLVIKDAASLQQFLATAHTLAESEEIEVTANIDLKGVELTGATSFAGTLAGNGYSLLNWESNGVSLFETLSGTVKNLKFDSTCSLTPADAVGPFGFLAKTVAAGGVVSYCENHADITFSPNNWASAGTQLGNATFFGALVGESFGKIEHSKNTGNVTITATTSSTITERGFVYIGGVVGRVDGKDAISDDATFVNVDTCENSGNISYTVNGVPGYIFMGGVVGGTAAQQLSSTTPVKANIKGCLNKGNVYYTFNNGGDMENGIDHSKTDKTSNYINMGGVVGYVEGSIMDCNNGIENDTSKGNVELLAPVCKVGQSASRVAVGGVAGFVMRNVTDCNNYSSITTYGSFHHGSGTTNPGSGKGTGVMTAGVVAQTGPSSNGQNFSVTNCHNFGPLNVDYLQAPNESGISHYVGGVGAAIYTAVSNCSNNATIDVYSTGAANYLGGVLGYVGFDASILRNNGLVNYNLHKSGTNHLGSNCWMGGVLGSGSTSYTLTDATNNRKVTINITKSDNVTLSRQIRGGGVAGTCGNTNGLTNNAEIEINECSNSGTPVWAGVVAVPYANESQDLHNKAAVTYNGATLNGMKIGGVIGMCSSKALSNCTNTHNVTVNATELTGTLTMGGIVADCDTTAGTISELNNSGNLTTYVGDNAYIGGVIGDSDKNKSTFDGIINSGTITYNIGERLAKKLVFGGICAFSCDGNTYSKCENSGAISIIAGGDASTVGYIGGIVGYNDIASKSQSVEGCTVSGDMNIKCPATWYAGGTLAWGGKWSSSNQSTMKNNVVTADISINSNTNNHYIGGLIGYSGLNSDINNNSFTGNISVGSTTGTGMVGGLLGATYIKPTGKYASAKLDASQTFTSNDVRTQFTYDATNSYAGLLLGGVINEATISVSDYVELSTMTVTYDADNTIKSGTTVNGVAATSAHINSTYSTDTFTLTTNGVENIVFE